MAVLKRFAYGHEKRRKNREDKIIAARNKNLDLAIQQIAKDYGDGAIMRLGDDTDRRYRCHPHRQHFDRSRAGRGRISAGRVVEVFGPESSGKTTLTLTVIAQAQKRGGLAAFIDVEHALDPQYARVSASIWMICWSRSRAPVKKRCASVETLVRSNALDVIVLDSVAALVTKRSWKARSATPPSARRRG